MAKNSAHSSKWANINLHPWFALSQYLQTHCQHKWRAQFLQTKVHCTCIYSLACTCSCLFAYKCTHGLHALSSLLLMELCIQLCFTHVCGHTHTDTQTHTDTHRPIDTQTHRHAQTHTDTQTHTDPQTHRHTDTHRHIQTHRHTDTQTHRHTQAHTDTQTHRHTDTQTHTHIHTHTHTHTLNNQFTFYSNIKTKRFCLISSTNAASFFLNTL